MANEKNLVHGIPQNYAMRLASQLNWVKRSVMGFKAQLHQSIIIYATRQPEYKDMSEERKEQLTYLQDRFNMLNKMLAQTKHDIEYFHKLPKYTPEYMDKIKNEKKARKAPPKPRKPRVRHSIPETSFPFL